MFLAQGYGEITKFKNIQVKLKILGLLQWQS